MFRMRQPSLADFARIATDDSEVRMTFIPTETEFVFNRNRVTGDLLATGQMQHRTIAGIGEYVEAEVQAMAFRVARDVVEGWPAYSIIGPEIHHAPTGSTYRIGDDDKLVPLNDRGVPSDYRAIVEAGALDARRRDRARDSKVEFRWNS